jgi:hypothetical protein
MACPCGCSAPLSRRALARPGISRGIGQAAATLSFDFSQYVPADIQNDAATARAYYDAFSQAAGAVSIKGGVVSMSPAAQEAVSGAIMATTEAAFTAALPGAGAVLALAYALAPKAGAGPGVCATDPPPSPYLGDLQSWQHFQSWASFWGAYAPAAAGSFEATAYAALEYNWLLGANCFADHMTPAPLLLASLIASWNAAHESTSTRTICRTVIPAAFAGQQYDPIAEALSEAAYARYTPPLPPNPTFEQAVNQTYGGPRSLSVCFKINDGPVKVLHVLTLKLRPSSVPLPVAAKLKANPPATSTAPLLAVAAVSAAAFAGWWVWIAKKPLPRFLR